MDTEIEDALADLSGLTPGGYFAALRMQGAVPKITRNTFPPSWVDHYSEMAYVMQDPIIHWSFANSGRTRWSDLAGNDPRSMFAEAATHGLAYGASFAMGDPAERSLLSIYHPDREFSDAELDAAEAIMTRLHELAGKAG